MRLHRTRLALVITSVALLGTACFSPANTGGAFCCLLADASGWTVLDPLSGRLVVARLEVPAAFDLPGFYRRAGFAVCGPFAPLANGASAFAPTLCSLTAVGGDS